MLSKAQIKRLPADPVGFVPVINRKNIPQEFAVSLPGRFLPMSVRTYQSPLIEIFGDQCSADIVLDSYLRKFFGVRFPNDPIKISKGTHIELHHSNDKSYVVKKPLADYGKLSVLCYIQVVPLYGIFACLARARVSLPKELAGKICKILKNIDVSPEVIFHGDPNHCCLWDMRCLSLNSQSDASRVEQLARFIQELNRPICPKPKSPIAPPAPADQTTSKPSRFSR